jgi:hypothetical protein
MSKCPKELVPTDGEHVDVSVIKRMVDYRVSPPNLLSFAYGHMPVFSLFSHTLIPVLISPFWFCSCRNL